MKLRILAGLAAAVVLWAQDTPGRVARLSYLYGDVSFRPGNVDDWAPATLNYPLSSGDHLWTAAESQAEVTVGLTAIHLAPETGWFIDTLDDRIFRMGVAEGALNVRIPRMEDAEKIEVETPYGTFRLLRTGSYRIDVQPEGDYASVTVRSGAAEVVAGTQTFAVAAGQRGILSGKPAAFELLAEPPLDDWDKWCAARDQALELGYEVVQPYVTWEVSGASDLAVAGDWIVDDDGGGLCWHPRHLPAGWAPYRFGHWVYRQPWGWTWIDDLPWGFAPFHWGRWKHLPAGWAWKPDPERHRPYSPALVAFSSTRGSHFISWIPLAPGERVESSRNPNRNREGMTTATQSDFAASKPIGSGRVIVIDHGSTTFGERTAEIMATRDALLGGRAHPVVAQHGNPEPVVAVPEAKQMMTEEPRPAPVRVAPAFVSETPAPVVEEHRQPEIPRYVPDVPVHRQTDEPVRRHVDTPAPQPESHRAPDPPAHRSVETHSPPPATRSESHQSSPTHQSSPSHSSPPSSHSGGGKK
jgi:hypothetical protein